MQRSILYSNSIEKRRLREMTELLQKFCLYGKLSIGRFLLLNMHGFAMFPYNLRGVENYIPVTVPAGRTGEGRRSVLI